MRAVPGSLIALAERSAIPVSIADAQAPDQPLAYVNQAFATQSGYDQSAIIGRNCRFLQGPATDQAVRRQIAPALAAGREVVCTLANYTKDGELFDNFLIMRHIEDDAGRPVFILGCQHFHKKRRVNDADLRRHIDTGCLIEAEFRRTMTTAGKVLQESQRLGADALFNLAQRYLQRSLGQSLLHA
ncbi:MAG: PAS domain-containing protein [Geminicoccaceae bacterium]|nr:MAG: PAS domain-containing protein [Geminicoccaceae bacterium]